MIITLTKKLRLTSVGIGILSLALCSSGHTAPAAKSSASSGNHVLVEEGVPKVSVVLSPGYSEAMEHGAKELIDHLREMSGAEVPLYKQLTANDLPKSEGIILITDTPKEGESPLGNEEYSITTEPGSPWTIRIFGDGKRGAMYGVYGFLQDQLNCRWFTPEISRIPKQKTIAVGDLDIRQKPSFEYREPYYFEAHTNRDWIVRNRVNGSNGHVDDSVGGKVRYGPGAYVHTFLDLVPPDKYFESHPEYFALVNGKRVSNTQICLTNPEVRKIVVEGVRKWIQDSPNADIFSVSQEDNEDGSCKCEECLKILNEEGAESGPILHFVNAVAAEIAKDYPNVKIETLAYNYSQAAPKKVSPLPNVRVRLCIPWSCKAHPIEAPCNKQTYDDLLAWSKITHQLYLWDYDTEYNDLLMLHPSLNYNKPAFRTFTEMGAIGVMMLGDYVSPGGSFSEVKAYLSARLMWDSSANPDQIVDEYIEGVYGKAAPKVKEWFTLIHSPFKAGSTVKEMGIYDLPTAEYLGNGILERSDTLIEEARKLAADEPQTLDQLEKIQMWIDYTKLAQLELRGKKSNGQYSFGLEEKDLARIDRFLAAIEKFKVERLAEAFVFNDKVILTRRNANSAAVTLENDTLRAEILPAFGGKLVQLFDKKKNLELLEQPTSVFRIFHGGYEMVAHKEKVEPERGDIDFQVSPSSSKDRVILTGTAADGTEITKEYLLKDNTLTSHITVKNTSTEPVPIQIWTRPQFPIQSFDDVDLRFKQLGGNTVILNGDDFSINWNRLSKNYSGDEKPAGEVDFALRSTPIKITFDPDTIETFHVWNEGGKPSVIAPEMIGKATSLPPGETASLSQTWAVGSR